MKKLLAALVAASFLATPLAASADQFRHKVIEKRFDRPVVIHKHRWDRGARLSRAERRNIVNARDYRRYRLSQPRRGEQWVRVDNQFLLISVATGLIVGLAAAR